jgi:glycosyltransferase involved in cell wall biosynthesis
LAADRDSVPQDSVYFAKTYDPVRGLRLRAEFVATLAALEPDVVHLHAGFTSIAAPLVNALCERWPTIGTLHDVSPFCMTGTRRFHDLDVVCTRRAGAGCGLSGCWRPAGVFHIPKQVAHLAVKSGLRQAWARVQHVTVPSTYVRDLALYHGFDPARTTIIPNFTEIPASASGSHDPRAILFVGALTRLKGVDLLINALALLREIDFRLIIVGDGHLRSIIAQLIDDLDLGNRVEPLGYLEDASIIECRRRSAFAVFPSRMPESFGYAGLESLAAGKPVVGFAMGGVADWLRHGETGVIAPEITPESLADAIRVLLENSELARHLGENGRKIASTIYSEEVYVTAIEKIFERIVSHAKRSAGDRR